MSAPPSVRTFQRHDGPLFLSSRTGTESHLSEIRFEGGVGLGVDEELKIDHHIYIEGAGVLRISDTALDIAE